MKLISWNVCGLNAPSKHRMLKKRITQEKVEIVMIQETKCDRETMGKITKKGLERV
jgi:exonuclease III